MPKSQRVSHSKGVVWAHNADWNGPSHCFDVCNQVYYMSEMRNILAWRLARSNKQPLMRTREPKSPSTENDYLLTPITACSIVTLHTSRHDRFLSTHGPALNQYTPHFYTWLNGQPWIAARSCMEFWYKIHVWEPSDRVERTRTARMRRSSPYD